MFNQMNNAGGNGAVGSGNKIGPGLTYKLLDMPGVNDATMRANSYTVPISQDRDFKVGDKIRGYDVDNEIMTTGEIVDFQKDADNNILYYVVLDNKNTKRKLDATDVKDYNVSEAITNTEGPKITGGVGEHLRPEDVDGDQLSVGILVEMEHTKDPKIAERIAIDHIYEHPNYYTILIAAGLVDEQPALELARELGLTKLSIQEAETVMGFNQWKQKNFI